MIRGTLIIRGKLYHMPHARWLWWGSISQVPQMSVRAPGSCDKQDSSCQGGIWAIKCSQKISDSINCEINLWLDNWYKIYRYVCTRLIDWYMWYGILYIYNTHVINGMIYFYTYIVELDFTLHLFILPKKQFYKKSTHRQQQSVQSAVSSQCYFISVSVSV